MIRWLLMLGTTVATARAAALPRADDPAHLTPADRQAMLATVRRAAGGEAVRFDPETLPAKLLRATGRPLLVSAHRVGHEPIVAAAAEGTLLEQLNAAARTLRDQGHLGDPAACRFKIDIVATRSPVGPGRPLRLGVDGVHVRAAGRETWLPPSEGLRLGLSTGEALLRRALEGARASPDLLVERFTTVSFIEREPGGGGPAVDLYRGMPLVRRVTRARLLASVEAAGDWLLRFQKPDGSFHYAYNAVRDTVGEGYSAVRHAGTAWSLVLAHGATGERRFLDGARRALDWLLARVKTRGEMAWVDHGGRQSLGAAALTVVGLVDYRAAAETKQLDERIRRLGRFLLFLQRDNGFFSTEYNVTAHRGYWPEGEVPLYAPGEATLALVRLARAWPDGPWKWAAVRAADFAVTKRDAWYAEHGLEMAFPDAWTMTALDELHALGAARRPHADYAFFLARLILEEQVRPGDTHWLDHVGAPRSTGEPPSVAPAAGRCEGLLAAWRLGRRMRVATERYRDAILLSLRFQLAHQYDAVNGYLLPNPARALGGFYASYADPTVRIDYVQHCISAMVGAAALLERDDDR